jgi:hypothetical protein
MNTDNPMAEPDYADDRDSGSVAEWRPRWVVEVGHNCRVGIAIDDGCFVVLYPKPGYNWKPGTHVPRQVA